MNRAVRSSFKGETRGHTLHRPGGSFTTTAPAVADGEWTAMDRNPAGPERADIEWHDSELLAVSVEAGEILLDLRAIVHRSQGAPGVESGTVWVQPASVVLAQGRHEGMWPPLPCPIADGRVETDGHDYDNLTPCPFRSNGRALLELHLATGDRVRIEAALVTLTFTGAPEYLEDFALDSPDE